MPRLSPSLIRRAYQLDPLLPRLLRECRDLGSARNELRWLREHACSGAPSSIHREDGVREWDSRLRKMVDERSQGKPLQYIIGDQPFGGLDILCREGVLIPRPETESYTTSTARWILSRFKDLTHDKNSGTNDHPSQNSTIRILDVCTGTGCIPLLLHSLLSPSFPNLHIVGTDISSQALGLAKLNLSHNISKGNLAPQAEHQVHFVHNDILNYSEGEHDSISPPTDEKWDVILSNPPYISPLEFRDGTTKPSVRRFEPELALVPPPRLTQSGADIGISISRETPAKKDAHARADSFYPHLLALSSRAGADLTVLECGDVKQAVRVRRLAERECGKVGIWRCDGLEDMNVPFRDGEEVENADPGNEDGARAVVLIRE